MDAEKSNTKHLIHKLKADRSGLRTLDGGTKNKVESWRKDLELLSNELQKHIEYIHSLHQDKKGKTKIDEKDDSTDVYENLFDVMERDVKKLLGLSEHFLQLPRKTTEKIEDEAAWAEIREGFSQSLVLYKMNLQEKNISKFEFFLKLLNMRDELTSQLLRGLLYQKTILWMDLNIESEEYVHSDIVSITERVYEAQKKYGYIPTKLEYEGIDFDREGIFTTSNRDMLMKGSRSFQTLDAFLKSYDDIKDVIQNSFNLTLDQKNQATSLNEKRDSLRTEVEKAKEHSAALEAELTKLRSDLRDPDKSEWFAVQNTVAHLRKECETRDRELRSKDIRISNLEVGNEAVKTRLKSLESEYNKLKNWYIPKLTEMEKVQIEIRDELINIRKDAEMLPGMFRAEATQKQTFETDKALAEERMEKAMTMLGREKRRCKELEVEIQRKERMALQAVAARNDIKQRVDELQRLLDRHNEEENSHQEYIERMKKETEFYKARYDEMYQSVMGLNNRINELEEHKKALLIQVKELGGKSEVHYLRDRAGGTQVCFP